MLWCEWFGFVCLWAQQREAFFAILAVMFAAGCIRSQRAWIYPFITAVMATVLAAGYLLVCAGVDAATGWGYSPPGRQEFLVLVAYAYFLEETFASVNSHISSMRFQADHVDANGDIVARSSL